MDRYTLDAVGILRYAVGELPDTVLDIFKASATGDAVVQAPAIAVIEAIYKFDRRDTVSGTQLSRPAEDVLDLVNEEMPVTMVETSTTDIRILAQNVSDYSIHDAMIVASHEANETDAIITTDENIGERVPTVWK